MISATGTATSTGAALRYRLLPSPAATPWSCSTTRPATQAAHAVTSATRRRHATRRGPVPAPRIRAGLTAGSWGLRCRQAAISGGPASAAATTAPASHQPSGGTAVPPGTTATARPAPHSAPGSAAISAPRPVTAPS